MLSFIAISISILSFLAAAIVLTRILFKRLVGRYPQGKSPDASVWGGLFILSIGLFEFFHTRWEALAHQPTYYKRALVTPAQGYAASIGNCVLGLIFIIVAFLQCRRADDNSPRGPSI